MNRRTLSTPVSFRSPGSSTRSDLGLRLADEGEDAGRLVAVTDPARAELVTTMAKRTDPGTGDLVRHAIAPYRGRDASEHLKRSATVTLAGVLEERRSLLQAELMSKDEGAPFEIANWFAIRHRRDDQQSDYAPAFLDWVFWWYLATIELTDRILGRQQNQLWAFEAQASAPTRPGETADTRSDRPTSPVTPGTATNPTPPTLTIKHQPRPVSAVFRPTPQWDLDGLDTLRRTKASVIGASPSQIIERTGAGPVTRPSHRGHSQSGALMRSSCADHLTARARPVGVSGNGGRFRPT